MNRFCLTTDTILSKFLYNSIPLLISLEVVKGDVACANINGTQRPCDAECDVHSRLGNDRSLCIGSE